MITRDQLIALKDELRTYDLNWMDKLVKHFEEKFPDEKDKFNRQKLYYAFNGAKKNQAMIIRIYTEAYYLLEKIKKDFQAQFPPTTVNAFYSNHKTTLTP